MMLHTIVIPTLNEEAEIQACLMRLQGLREEGFEVIVVDGGSTDKTAQLAEGLCDQFISTRGGRAAQMNAGARQARGEFIFFLHVDTQLPEKFQELIPEIEADTFCWGRFDVKLSGEHWSFRIIESMMNLRSRLTGIATGDQVMFVSQKLFRGVGGFPEIALMEDIAMSRSLKKIASPLCLRQKVFTSSRRWEKHGIISTILKMWWLRFSYFMGVDPVRLARQYD
jgi:rSAM/selenodomain-associated transferase 2